MKQPKPIIHGRDHANGGPDPIPGLGAGGGALAWEDVGTPGTPAVDPWTRYAVVLGTIPTLVAGEYRIVWTSVARQYSPEGPLVDLQAYGGAPAGHHIRLLHTGTYDINFRFLADRISVSTPPPQMSWQIYGAGTISSGNLGTAISMTDWLLSGGSLYYPLTDLNIQVYNSGAGQGIRFYSADTAAGGIVAMMGCAARITRLAPS